MNISSYAEFCKYYDYDPESEEAKENYERAKEALARFAAMELKQSLSDDEAE